MPDARTEYAAGTTIGPWTLREHLGSGGNAEVWRATGELGEAVALKVLRRRSGDGYARFRAEIAVMATLRDSKGVLPLLASDLPERPSRSMPAWLAMPEATLLRDALGPAPSLREVATAVEAIARTLAGLHERLIYHRDIKPGNLYSWSGVPAVGDFGLVTYPDKAAITQGGRQLGPLGFLAPEMLRDAASVSDAGPADVYSLGKTVFVLISGQNFPPQGPQRADDPSVQLGQFTEQTGTRSLERLLERVTQNDPSNRPTMREFADELHGWLSMPAEPAGGGSLDHLRTRVDEAMTPNKAAAAREQQRSHDLAQATYEVVLPLRDFQHRLADIGLDNSTLSPGTELFNVSYRQPAGAIRYGCQLRVAASGVTLVSGLAAELTVDDELRLLCGHVLHLFGTRNSDVVIWREERMARLGSVTQERFAKELVAQLIESGPEAAEAFVANFHPGVRPSPAQPPLRRFQRRTILKNVPEPGSVLVAFADPANIAPEAVVQNWRLAPGAFDARLMDGFDEELEREARIQMYLAGVR